MSPDIQNNSYMKIDVDAVIRQRLPKHYKYIPKFIIRRLEKLICQDRMNSLLEKNRDKRDAEFCRGILTDLNVGISVYGLENLPPVDNRRVLFVSNHPLGGLDGMAIIDFVQSRYGGRPKFIVNDLLSAIEPLSGVFIPVNKHGSQSRDAVKAVDEAFASDDPVMMFPAGLVSRRQKGGIVKDLPWQKMFVGKARKYHRDIIPVHFIGHNSSFFYKFAKFREKLGLKFNIEMIFLPKEVFRSENKSFAMVIGAPIPWESLPVGEKPEITAQKVKETVYSLKPPQNGTTTHN